MPRMGTNSERRSMSTNPMIERLQAAAATLQEVADLAVSLPEQQKQALEMGMHLSVSITYLNELALNLVHGVDTYDAVLAAAKGSTQVN